MKHDLVLLYSGGYDSTLLLKMAIHAGFSPVCLLIDYGQKHVEELEYAKKMCQKIGVSYFVLKIELNTPSNLTKEAKTYEGVSPYHVPARNLIFIGLAVSYAEGHDIPLVWYGANYEDREKLFPDCYQEWVYRINELLAINGSSKVRIEAPLLGMTKDTIKRLAKNFFNINENEIFSGYERR